MFVGRVDPVKTRSVFEDAKYCLPKLLEWNTIWSTSRAARPGSSLVVKRWFSRASIRVVKALTAALSAAFWMVRNWTLTASVLC